jgi:hypothetical protein
LYLEPGWNASNDYSNEYGKVLLNRYQGSHREKLVFCNLLGHDLSYEKSEITNR